MQQIKREIKFLFAREQINWSQSLRGINVAPPPNFRNIFRNDDFFIQLKPFNSVEAFLPPSHATYASGIKEKEIVHASFLLRANSIRIPQKPHTLQIELPQMHALHEGKLQIYDCKLFIFVSNIFSVRLKISCVDNVQNADSLRLEKKVKMCFNAVISARNVN